MTVFKCKMCGASLNIENNEKIIECEYCGSKQTLPRLDDDRRANLYDRANHFRRNNEFDKAVQIYEQILNEDKSDAEAYWSLVLCTYGVEYVEDSTTHKRVPTINRASYTSIFDDENYKSALEYADGYQREIYIEEAKTLNEIQKGILAISQNEEPFDVFICYKESDSNGRRTQDSVLANDLYHQLTQEGFKVFFARITLEDKLGSAYEPYIFSALNSSKVMVVLGTKPEYFNAVWVKNEWSRYLSLIKGGAKKVLIPAYKGMDAYDLPNEFAHLQAQDMSKLGFMQDLIRGIRKLASDGETTKTISENVIISREEPLLERMFLFLDECNWQKADEYSEKVLDISPKCSKAYLGKLLIDLKCKKIENLSSLNKPFDKRASYKKYIRFANENEKAEIEKPLQIIKDRINTLLSAINNRASELLCETENIEDLKTLVEIYSNLGDFSDSKEKAEQVKSKIRNLFINQINEIIATNDPQNYWKLNNILDKLNKANVFNSEVKDIQSKVFSILSDWNKRNKLSAEMEILKADIEKDTEIRKKQVRKLKLAIWFWFITLIFIGVEVCLGFAEVKWLYLVIFGGISLIGIILSIIFSKKYKRVKKISLKHLKAKKKYLNEISEGEGAYTDISKFLKVKYNKADDGYVIKKVKKINRYKVAIPEKIKGKYIVGLGEKCFKNQSFRIIKLPNHLKYIDSFAFSNCSNLTNILIPNSITRIESWAFDSCFSLNFNEYDNALYLGNDSNPYLVLVTAKNSEKTCNINPYTKIIYDKAFYYCKNVDIFIPISVKIIGKKAFGGQRIFYAGSRDDWYKLSPDESTQYCVYWYRKLRPTEYPELYWHYNENGEIECWGSSK